MAADATHQHQAPRRSRSKRSVRRSPDQAKPFPTRTSESFFHFANAFGQALGVTRSELVQISILAFASTMCGGEVRVPYRPSDAEWGELIHLSVEARALIRWLRRTLRSDSGSLTPAERRELYDAIRELSLLSEEIAGAIRP